MTDIMGFPAVLPRFPAVPAVVCKSLILLVPQCSPRGSRGMPQVFDFIAPEVPAPQSPYPYTRCARFESGARAMKGADREH